MDKSHFSTAEHAENAEFLPLRSPRLDGFFGVLWSEAWLPKNL